MLHTHLLEQPANHQAYAISGLVRMSGPNPQVTGSFRSLLKTWFTQTSVSLHTTSGTGNFRVYHMIYYSMQWNVRWTKNLVVKCCCCFLPSYKGIEDPLAGQIMLAPNWLCFVRELVTHKPHASHFWQTTGNSLWSERPQYISRNHQEEPCKNPDFGSGSSYSVLFCSCSFHSSTP